MKVYKVPEVSNSDFYHWFYLALGTLAKIRDISGIVYYRIPNENLEFQVSSLKYLTHTFVQEAAGTPVTEYIELPRIIMGQNNSPIDKEIYPFLRTQFYLKNKFETFQSLSRLIYISREKSHRYNNRKVVNECDILDRLKLKGFEILYLEELPFDEKVKAFVEAKLILTPTGGAMSLGIFMNEKAKMIEITSPGTYTTDHLSDIYKELKIPFEQYTNVDAINQHGQIVGGIEPFANLRLRDASDILRMVDIELEKLKDSDNEYRERN